MYCQLLLYCRGGKAVLSGRLYCQLLLYCRGGTAVLSVIAVL